MASLMACMAVPVPASATESSSAAGASGSSSSSGAAAAEEEYSLASLDVVSTLAAGAVVVCGATAFADVTDGKKAAEVKVIEALLLPIGERWPPALTTLAPFVLRRRPFWARTGSWARPWTVSRCLTSSRDAPAATAWPSLTPGSIPGAVSCLPRVPPPLEFRCLGRRRGGQPSDRISQRLLPPPPLRRTLSTENHRGQLGVGDEDAHGSPTLVAGLKKEKIVHAATGKAHTVFITASGQVRLTHLSHRTHFC